MMIFVSHPLLIVATIRFLPEYQSGLGNNKLWLLHISGKVQLEKIISATAVEDHYVDDN